MDELIKRRLIGASVLAIIAIILLPLLFSHPQDPRQSIKPSFKGTPQPYQPIAAEDVRLIQDRPASHSANSTAPPIQPTAAPRPAERAQPTPAPTAKPTPRPTPKPPPTATPSPKPTPVPATPSPAPTAKATPAPPASGWILQLISYKSKQDAEAFLARLAKDGYQAYLEPVDVRGVSYQRVRMGLSMSRTEALKLKGQIEKQYRLEAQLLEAG